MTHSSTGCSTADLISPTLINTKLCIESPCNQNINSNGPLTKSTQQYVLVSSGVQLEKSTPGGGESEMIGDKLSYPRSTVLPLAKATTLSSSSGGNSGDGERREGETVVVGGGSMVVQVLVLLIPPVTSNDKTPS